MCCQRSCECFAPSTWKCLSSDGCNLLVPSMLLLSFTHSRTQHFPWTVTRCWGGKLLEKISLNIDPCSHNAACVRGANWEQQITATWLLPDSRMLLWEGASQLKDSGSSSAGLHSSVLLKCPWATHWPVTSCRAPDLSLSLAFDLPEEGPEWKAQRFLQRSIKDKSVTPLLRLTCHCWVSFWLINHLAKQSDGVAGGRRQQLTPIAFFFLKISNQ